MADVLHEHACQDGRDNSAEKCRSRLYCVCGCGAVAPHPRSARPRDQEWMTLDEMSARFVVVHVKHQGRLRPELHERAS